MRHACLFVIAFLVSFAASAVHAQQPSPGTTPASVVANVHLTSTVITPGTEESARVYLSNLTESEIIVQLIGQVLRNGKTQYEYDERTVLLAPLSVSTFDYPVAIDETARLGRYSTEFTALSLDDTPFDKKKTRFLVRYPSPVTTELNLDKDQAQPGDLLVLRATLTSIVDTEVELAVHGWITHMGRQPRRHPIQPQRVVVVPGEPLVWEKTINIRDKAPEGRYVVTLLVGEEPSQKPLDGARAEFHVSAAPTGE